MECAGSSMVTNIDQNNNQQAQCLIMTKATFITNCYRGLRFSDIFKTKPLELIIKSENYFGKYITNGWRLKWIFFW